MNYGISSEEDTRIKLLKVGIRLFGEYGFEATTTRKIADEANSNIGSIAYHFGSKRALYLSSIEYIADNMRNMFNLEALRLPDKGGVELSRDEAREILQSLVSTIFRTFAVEEEPRSWLLLIIREQVNPTEAFRILYDRVFDIIYSTFGSLIALLTGMSVDDRRAFLEAHTLIGQIVFFLIGRNSLLMKLGEIKTLDSHTIDMAEEILLSHIAAYTSVQPAGLR